MLAGISVEYYTRLERGNAAGVSDDVLEGIARALQLDEAERAHLFDLVRAANANSANTRRRPSQERVRPTIKRILDSITAPAYVRNGRLDLLAANTLGAALYAPVFDSATGTPNMARFIFPESEGERLLRRLAAHRERRCRDPASRGRPRSVRQAPLRPHRRAFDPLRRVPCPLGGAQLEVPPHRRQVSAPPNRRRPDPRLRGTRPSRRQRAADPRLQRRTGERIAGSTRPARQLGDCTRLRRRAVAPQHRRN
jgi:transcriptional regulator with XRE-family HTH domain